MFCKEDALKIFAKFAGKHLCQSLFFNKVAGLRLGISIEILGFSFEILTISKICDNRIPYRCMCQIVPVNNDNTKKKEKT